MYTTTITITTTITTWQINPQIWPTFENDFLVTLQILRHEWGPTGFLIVRICEALCEVVLLSLRFLENYYDKGPAFIYCL